MKRLRLFNTDQQYNNDKGQHSWPTISWIKESTAKLRILSSYEKYAKQYLTFEALESGTFAFTGNSVDYSLDNGETWTTLESEVSTPTVAARNTIMFKTTAAATENGVGTFSSTGRFNVMGNAYSIGYGDDFESVMDISESGSNYLSNLFNGCTGLVSAKYLILQATTLSPYCYRYMFEGCTSLIDVPKLPAMTLTDYCYGQMFKNCSSLTFAYHKLPAMTLATCCYSEMFYGCSSLKTSPILPATSLTQSCYGSMFFECTGLIKAPKLPATTFVGNNVYQYMFFGCTSLTKAPALPATTLKPFCYQYMFWDCINLTTPPKLPAKTLTQRCYYFMFNNCQSLTRAPELPAKSLATQCYQGMFKGCSKLNYIKAMFTTTPGEYCTNWVNGVAATGKFVKNSAATWTTTGTGGVPSGWTIETASE